MVVCPSVCHQHARTASRRRRPVISGQQRAARKQLAALRSLLPTFNTTTDLQVLLEAIRYISHLRQQLAVK